MTQEKGVSFNSKGVISSESALHSKEHIIFVHLIIERCEENIIRMCL